ncbi:hypothetical protein CRG98_037257 [Punica granatum]|uniref:Retrotransposon gag domain-containing protein n=1 Tax=Punica granatum TaxID=22663 RepID=A0A2I0IEB5_PUNGR|nr:hypothetical protein CRG98_037257 [Punica granatum]
MDLPAPGLRLEAITPPRQDIMRIWRTLRPVDRAFIQGIIGDVVMFTETPVDWIFLRTTIEFWDPEHAVFNFQGMELALTIEEYTALIQRPTSTTQGIFVPNPFAIWLLAHVRPFCSSHPFSYIMDERSLIERLVPVIPPPKHSFSEWRRFWRELTPARFLWVTRWNPGGPMITGCPGIAGVPLLSHLGSTLVFPGRVIRQLGGLQDIPAEADRLPYRIQWADSTSTAPARFLQIREIHHQRDTSTIQRLYFPEHLIDEERALSATSAYVAQFYLQGSTSPQRSQTIPTPRVTPTPALEAESSTQAAMRAELRAIREERDRLRCELVDSRAERLRMAEEDRVDTFEEVNPPVPTHSQPPPTHAPPPPTTAGILPAYSGAPPTHLPPPTSSGAPLPPVSLTSSASDDQARITALEGTVNQLAASMAANMAELFTLLRGPNRASSSSTPPPRQGPTSIFAATGPHGRPSSTGGVPHFGSRPIRAATCFHAGPSCSLYIPSVDGTPTHTAQVASPTHFFPEADAEQELRIKRMEETIRALQASDTRPDARYGDCSLFPGMRLPSKFKIPEFKTYEGTTDPRHHLRHYRGKMLQYWGYEEFVIHSFQDSLSGSALDWFMSLKAEDIPTWADLSRNKTQQIQLFHSTLRGIYYSHLLAHTSSFSDLIKAGKKLDLGIKLGRMEGPTGKGEESSKKVLATTSSSSGKRGMEVSVNAINPTQPTPQQYLVNFTTSPTAAPAYFPPPPQHQHQSVYYSAPPVPPPMASQPFDHHYAPAPTSPRPLVSRAPPPDQSKRCEYHQSTPGHTLDNCWRLRDEIQKRIDSNKLTFNAVRPPNVQDNPLPDHRPNSGPSINMISICASGRDEDAQDNPLPFVIDYTPEEPTVPWTYEGSVESVEQQFSVMGMTRSGRVYENPAARDKGKAPAIEVGAVPESSPFPSKRVTEEEAETFMKIIKASEYKVVDQMAKSPAHISLLALLLNSEPHREALLRVLTAAQIPKETPPDRIEETVGSIFGIGPKGTDPGAGK